METLLATYAVAWAVVSAYVAWLAARNGRLARRLERLEAKPTETQSRKTRSAKAA